MMHWHACTTLLLYSCLSVHKPSLLATNSRSSGYIPETTIQLPPQSQAVPGRPRFAQTSGRMESRHFLVYTYTEILSLSRETSIQNRQVCYRKHVSCTSLPHPPRSAHNSQSLIMTVPTITFSLIVRANCQGLAFMSSMNNVFCYSNVTRTFHSSTSLPRHDLF